MSNIHIALNTHTELCFKKLIFTPKYTFHLRNCSVCGEKNYLIWKRGYLVGEKKSFWWRKFIFLQKKLSFGRINCHFGEDIACLKNNRLYWKEITIMKKISFRKWNHICFQNCHFQKNQLWAVDIPYYWRNYLIEEKIH